MAHSLMAGQEVVALLSNIFEVKDLYTAGHSKRVAIFSQKIAKEMGLSEEEQHTIYQAGLLHDIGKILTPEAILLKPRKFNNKEYAIMQNHSIDGENMISCIPSLQAYAHIIRHHHERYDGKGYPDALRGKAIPLLSRIMCVADAFDAMTTNRIYGTQKNLSDAIFEIDRCCGKQFDPEIAKYAITVFCSHTEWRELPDICEYAIHEDRLAYFYKDTLTSAFTGEYLNHFLTKQKAKQKYNSCLFIQTHNMHHYNQHFGWHLGDKALREIAVRLRVLFASNTLFRLFGDDFVILNPTSMELCEKELLSKLAKGLTGLEFSLTHLSPQHHEKIEKWEHFERYLKKAS